MSARSKSLGEIGCYRRPEHTLRPWRLVRAGDAGAHGGSDPELTRCPTSISNARTGQMIDHGLENGPRQVVGPGDRVRDLIRRGQRGHAAGSRRAEPSCLLVVPEIVAAVAARTELLDVASVQSSGH